VTVQPQDSYDVVILGGGLAGLCLGLQLKKERPETSILIAEKREGPAPEAAFKVGESTVEISANYFGEVVGMKDHIESDQLHKVGLRYFFPAGDNTDLSQRVEWGVPFKPPVPSYQLDRGRFENELGERNVAAGVDLLGGCRVQEVELNSDSGHVVTLTRGDETIQVTGHWVVDAAGRAFVLKRQLDLLEDNGHNVNSAWLRLAGGINVEDWVDQSDDEWFAPMTERGLRQFSTNHLCGQGYWVWLIPLSSGSISIGIVAEERFHPYEQIRTLEGTLQWFRDHEPQLAEVLDARQDQIEDFLKVGDFSYGCKQVYSGSRRWCLVGEAGPFLDPFYSPGSDFIAMGNTLTTDLITRELNGEDVTERAKTHNDLFLRFYREALNWYEGQYVFWGDPQVMIAKIACNNIVYWSTSALLFFNRKLTEPEFMAEVMPDLERIWKLNVRLEAMFRDWFEIGAREWHRAFMAPTGFPSMGLRHVELGMDFDDEALKAKIKEDADLVEAVATLVFRKAAESLPDGAPDPEEKVNPYAISLDPGRWEADGLFDGSGLTVEEAGERAPGIENLWLDAVAKSAA
jgi:flavin-dependent dehydrogenase